MPWLIMWYALPDSRTCTGVSPEPIFSWLVASEL